MTCIFRILALMLGAGLTLSGCFQQSVKIGVALPLSGKSTPRGQEILNAVLLAVEDVNHYGGVQGHRVELMIQDDQDSPVPGRQAAEALIHAHVLGVVGHYSSDVTLSALPLYQEAHMALVSPAVSLSRIPSEGQYFFRTLGSNVQQAQAAAKFLHTSGFRRIAVVHNASLYGQDLAECLRTSLQAFPDVGFLSLADKAESFDRLKRLMPELVFYAGGYQDAAQFLQKMRENGLSSDFMGGNTLSDSEFVRLTGLAQNREIWTTAGRRPPEGFVNRYTQRFGPPGPFTMYAYDAARLLLSAANQATDLNAEGVQSELAHRRVYQGLSGPILLAPGQPARQPNDYGILAITSEGKFVDAQPLQPRFGKAGLRFGSYAHTAVQKRKPPAPKSPSSPASPARPAAHP